MLFTTNNALISFMLKCSCFGRKLNLVKTFKIKVNSFTFVRTKYNVVCKFEEEHSQKKCFLSVKTDNR